MPMRVAASLPATRAVSSALPSAPAVSATASAAGATTTLMCETDGGWVSSKSSAWHSVPLANAASCAGAPSRRPITLAGPSAACSRVTASAYGAVSSACAASPQPSVSSRWSLAAASTSWGIRSSARSAANAASFCAGVLIGVLSFALARLSVGPGRVGAGKAVGDLGSAAPVDHEGPPELDHDLAPLVDAPCPHADDPDARPRLRRALVEHLALRPQRVAFVDRVGQADVAPREVRGRVLAGVGDAHAGDQRERQRAVDERTAEARAGREHLVEVDLVRVERQQREP